MEYRESRYFNRTECDICASGGPCHWCGRKAPETVLPQQKKDANQETVNRDLMKNLSAKSQTE